MYRCQVDYRIGMKPAKNLEYCCLVSDGEVKIYELGAFRNMLPTA